jgi:Xaa-Pro aminopeptidase
MESSHRITRISQALVEAGLDALLAVSPAACTYLSGCHLLTQTAIPDREAYVLLPAEGDPAYLVCNIEEASARAESRIEDVHTYVEFKQSPAGAAAALLQSRGLGNGRIAYEAGTMRAGSLAALRAALPEAAWQPWDEPLRHHWMVKSDQEIAALRRAGEDTRAAIEKGLTDAAPGASERALAARILTGIMQAGITPMFDVFAAGPNMTKVHAVAGDRVPKPGELIRLDMGGRQAGTHVLSDMARTAVVGEPSARQADTLAALAEIQAMVMRACQVGRPAGSLYDVCAAGFEKYGLPFTMPHIGHGLGIDLHEAPILHPGNETPLQAGMVLNIEPFVALADQGETYHVEDLVLVVENGPQWLTKPQTALIRAPV